MTTVNAHTPGLTCEAFILLLLTCDQAGVGADEFRIDPEHGAVLSPAGLAKIAAIMPNKRTARKLREIAASGAETRCGHGDVLSKMLNDTAAE